MLQLLRLIEAALLNFTRRGRGGNARYISVGLLFCLLSNARISMGLRHEAQICSPSLHKFFLMA